MYGIHVFTGLDPPPSLPHPPQKGSKQRTAQLFSGRKKSFTKKRTFIFFLDFYINSDIYKIDPHFLY